MTYTQNIVENLKRKGVQPFAFASSSSSFLFDASNALICNKNEPYMSDVISNKPQWWAVDFKHVVSIFKYQIMTGEVISTSFCIYNWTLSVSINNITWKTIHGPLQNTLSDKSCSLEFPESARFARIDGNSYNSKYPKGIHFYFVKFIGIVPFIASCKIRKGFSTNLLRIIFLIYS